MRVLVVEDEVYLAEAIKAGLKKYSIISDIVHDGYSALEYVDYNDYDVMLLDRDIPGMHGDQVCKKMVENRSRCCILMLTASWELDDRINGFELGADDYLTKPFQFPELVVRLRALGRRRSEIRPSVLEYVGIKLDPFRQEVYREGEKIFLCRKEFIILEILMKARGGVVSSETLLEKAWDENADPFTNVVRVTISNLRKHLGEPGLIKTVSGRGYTILQEI